ncbi:MAG: UvrD-helicase domain-containing protein [Pseudomonadota bacterium]
MSSSIDLSIDHDPREEAQTQAQSLFNDLNPAQKKAAETTEGPVLVLAGAGTGKTRVLTTRLAYLLHTNKAMPGQILAVTFTNKAAQEMKHRVSALLGGAPVEGWWLGTFHSLAARMLRTHADMVGLTSNFTILDADDQVRLVKQLAEDNQIDTKKYAPKFLADQISSFKDKAKTPSDISADDIGDIADGKLGLIYTQYQNRLKILNACDFGDLLLHMITILKDPKNHMLLEDYHRRFRYLLVDEYQDTNVAQYLWLRLLAKGSNNICCVGDDDQSIYGWRGAEVDNILRFEKDFENAVVIRLEENYRSTGHILSAANHVIANNDGRLGKELFTSAGEGEKVFVRGLWDGPAEARYIGEEIESLQSKQVSLNQMAVLVRTGFQMREFEERFIQLNLPYRVIGGPRFYERKEVRDALAYLRVVMQSHDDLALERIINVPKRGIGDATIQTLYTHARAKNISLYQSILDLTQTEELKPKIRSTLMKLVDDFERWRSLKDTVHQSELAATILDESGYNDMWKQDKSPDAPGRLENLKELVASMEEFETLEAFLEHIALVLDNQSSDNGEFVTLMTLHAAKGLEYDYVFLPGWEDGLFPSQRSMDENGLKGLEEERRLAYVAITRAKKRATISYVANRRMYGNWVNAFPSRFIQELPEDHIEAEADLGLYSPGRSSHWDSSGFGGSDDNDTYTRTVNRKSAGGEFQTGDAVFHDKFGTGKIIHIDGHKLDIHFDQAGQKRVMDSFVTKA